MLIGGIALGLILGLFAGGHITNLAFVRLQRMGLLFAAVFIRFRDRDPAQRRVPAVAVLCLPLLAGSF